MREIKHHIRKMSEVLLEMRDEASKCKDVKWALFGMIAALEFSLKRLEFHLGLKNLKRFIDDYTEDMPAKLTLREIPEDEIDNFVETEMEKHHGDKKER